MTTMMVMMMATRVANDVTARVARATATRTLLLSETSYPII